MAWGCDGLNTGDPLEGDLALGPVCTGLPRCENRAVNRRLESTLVTVPTKDLAVGAIITTRGASMMSFPSVEALSTSVRPVKLPIAPHMWMPVVTSSTFTAPVSPGERLADDRSRKRHYLISLSMCQVAIYEYTTLVTPNLTPSEELEPYDQESTCSHADWLPYRRNRGNGDDRPPGRCGGRCISSEAARWSSPATGCQIDRVLIWDPCLRKQFCRRRQNST